MDPNHHTEQPPPVPSDRPHIHDQVCEDLQARKAVGVQRYGQALQAFNRRDAGRDAYEECLDMAVYLRQHREERETLDRLTSQLVRAAQKVVNAVDDELVGDVIHVSVLRGAIGRYVQAAEQAGIRPLVDLNAGYDHTRGDFLASIPRGKVLDREELFGPAPDGEDADEHRQVQP